MDTLNRGFSIIEILIAMAIGIIVISGVVAGSGGFGTALRGYQSTITGGEIHAEALEKAQSALETAQALGRRDFNFVNPTAATSSSGFYYTSVDVTVLPDFLTKLVTAQVSWRTGIATSSVTLSTLVTNLENVQSPNTCDSALRGNWKSPQVSAPIPVADPASGASGNSVTDIAAFYKKLYITTDNAHKTNADFYIFDISANAQSPIYLASLRTITNSAGLAALAVSSSTAGTYVYAASAYNANFVTCKTGPNCSQLQIINATNPASPTVAAHFALATSTPPYVLGAPGKSIFYKDGYVYLGLETTSNGPSFHIIDVRDSSNPVWVGSWPASTATFGSSGAPINGIYVKGNYAYLLHPNGLTGTTNEQITVLDIRNPSSPQRVGSFFNSGGIGGNGRAVFPVGDTLYFVRTKTSNAHPEFYILNNADPTQLSANNTNPPGRIFGETVNRVFVRSNLAFIISSSTLQTYDISNPARIATEAPAASWTIPSLGASSGNAADCEGNTVYIGSYRASDDKGVILVLSPGP